jgi:MOSC domain-containing protein YiiM
VARVVSLQVGRPADLPGPVGTLWTAIVKQPVDGPVVLRELDFDGDQQADLTVHGGPDKAACCYPTEHVPKWEEWLGVPLPYGAFGENLSLAGILEDDVNIGDVYEIGGATVQVSQPRGPCFKLAARHRRKELPAVMARLGISGWYFRTLTEGPVEAGDELRLTERTSDVSVADVMRVTYRDRDDLDTLADALAVPELAPQWRESLEYLARRKGLPVTDFGV